MDGLRDKRRYAFSLILVPVKLTYRAYACLVCVANIFTQVIVRTFERPKEKNNNNKGGGKGTGKPTILQKPTTREHSF